MVFPSCGLLPFARSVKGQPARIWDRWFYFSSCVGLAHHVNRGIAGMESQKRSALHWLLVVAVVAIAASVLYTRREQSAADRVKAEAVGIVQDMSLLPDWEEKVLELVDVAHPQAFAKALDVTKELGRKFDASVYYKELFDLVIASAREEGKNDLADSLDRQRKSFQLSVTER